MERVAVDFWRWPRRERSTDIRSDLGQASNAGQHQKRRNPPGASQKGRLAASLVRCSPLRGCASLAPCHPPLLTLRAAHSSISTVSYETVEILEWAARRVRRGGWQGASEAHPRSGLQRTSDAARRPFWLAPGGLRRFWCWPALLAWPRSLRISVLRSRLGQRQKSTATRSIPVFQRSHKRSSICAIGFATSANPITTSAIPHQRSVEINSPRKIQQPSGTRISTTRDRGNAMVIGIYLST